MSSAVATPLDRARRGMKAWGAGNALLCLTAALAALLLKHAYSQAGAGDLRWVLDPTARLVELCTGSALTWEAGAGYLSTDLGVLITPACAGVNFLIIAFLSLSFGLATRAPGWAKLASLALCAALAYAATLAVNTTRIVLSARLGSSPSWLAHDQLHRVEGVVVYLGGLLIVYAIASRLPFFAREPA